MKQLLIFIFLALSHMLPAGNKHKEPAKTLKVMSYNIHYGLGMDKKYDLERIAEVIAKQNPDIVGLQEIGDSAMAAKLGELTGMYYVFGPSKESAKEYGDAILSKYLFEWIDNFSIPSASSSRYQIMGIKVDLTKKFGASTKIRFLNTHFDWTRSIGSQEARIATVDVIERGFFENEILPTILTGDLNSVPNSVPLQKLRKKGWVNRKGGKELYTIPVVDPRRQIDYILVRPKKAWNIIDIKVIQEQVASDHLPVVMTIELKK